MSSHKKTFKTAFIAFFGLSLLANCSSQTQTIYPTPPKKYEKLGRVTGTATGSLGISLPGITAAELYFIPMGLNSRVQRAYYNALSKAPGATSLIDVSYKEDWYWWVLGTAREVTISGEAIKEIK